jgi:hypothetical protein
VRRPGFGLRISGFLYTIAAPVSVGGAFEVMKEGNSPGTFFGVSCPNQERE